MFDLLILGLAAAGAASLSIFIVAKVRGETLDEAFAAVLDFIKKELCDSREPFFNPASSPALIERVREAVATQSALSVENTLCSVVEEPFVVVNVQIVPKNPAALDLAQAAAATLLSNAAQAAGFSPEVETGVLSCPNGSSVIQVGLATNAAQKEALGRYRSQKNSEAVLNAAGPGEDFVDDELEEDLKDAQKTGSTRD